MCFKLIIINSLISAVSLLQLYGLFLCVSIVTNDIDIGFLSGLLLSVCHVVAL